MRPPSFVPTGISDLDDLAVPIGMTAVSLPGTGTGGLSGATIGWTSGGVPITEATRAALTAGRVQIGLAPDGLPLWGYPGQTTRTEGGAVIVRNDQLGPGADNFVPVAIINPQGGTPTGGGGAGGGGGGGGAVVTGTNGTTQTVMLDGNTIVRPVLDSLNPRLGWIEDTIARQIASAQATAEHRDIMNRDLYRRDVLARLMAIQTRLALGNSSPAFFNNQWAHLRTY